jgi:hypothetical protein
VIIWYIFPRFGRLRQEKSGNPAPNSLKVERHGKKTKIGEYKRNRFNGKNVKKFYDIYALNLYLNGRNIYFYDVYILNFCFNLSQITMKKRYKNSFIRSEDANGKPMTKMSTSNNLGHSGRRSIVELQVVDCRNVEKTTENVCRLL